MSRRVDFETVLKDKFFLFQVGRRRRCGDYSNRIRTKYTAKWGVQIVGMIFQTRSNTTKSEAGIWKKFYMPASLFYRFVYSFTLLYCPFPENLYSPLRIYQNRLLCRLFQMCCHRTLLCSHPTYLLNLI